MSKKSKKSKELDKKALKCIAYSFMSGVGRGLKYWPTMLCFAMASNRIREMKKVDLVGASFLGFGIAGLGGPAIEKYCDKKAEDALYEVQRLDKDLLKEPGKKKTDLPKE